MVCRVRDKHKTLEDVADLSSVGDGLQLQGRQAAAVDGLLWDGQPVPHVWGVDAGQGAGLHHGVGVAQADLHCTDRQQRLGSAQLAVELRYDLVYQKNTVTLTFHRHVLCVRLCVTQLVLLLFLRLVLLLHPRRFLHRDRHTDQ